MGVIGDFFGGLLDPIGTAYKIYQDQRNFNYEKKLQQQVFSREDTAYQRAVADAQAAGLSKGVVAGGAGSGAVLGASSTDIGSTDFMSRYQQRKMNALSMKQMDEDYSMTKSQHNLLRMQMNEQEFNLRSKFPWYKGIAGPNAAYKWNEEEFKKYQESSYSALIAEQEAKKAKFEYYANHPWLDDAMSAASTLLNAGVKLIP